jgi:hypothetical protein
MSGTQNPLAAAMPGMPAVAPTNAAGNAAIPQAPPAQRQGPPPVDAIMGHYAAAGLGPDDFPRAMARVKFLANTMAKLAFKPDATRKDVIKAAADGVGTGHITADEAVNFLNKLPEGQEQLQQWLRQAHSSTAAGAVALHAYGHKMLQAIEARAAGGGPVAPPGAAPGGVAPNLLAAGAPQMPPGAPGGMPI